MTTERGSYYWMGYQDGVEGDQSWASFIADPDKYVDYLVGYWDGYHALHVEVVS